MPFKTILLVVGVNQGDEEIERAAAIAAGLGSHLSVLVLGIAPPPPSSPYGVVSNDIWASEIQEGQAEAQVRAAQIEGWLAKRGAPGSVEAQYIDRATVTTLVARFARYADATLIPPQAEDVDVAIDWVTNGALFESGRPVILLPEGAFRFPQVDCAMIAWDASVEASKAVRDAIELMKGTKTVHAVLVDPVPSFDGHGAEPGADLAAYLARHGISVTVHRLPSEGRDVASVLMRQATDFDVDLVVMGGFGHSRLRQRIFGGTTLSTVKAHTVPVLMSH